MGGRWGMGKGVHLTRCATANDVLAAPPTPTGLWRSFWAGGPLARTVDSGDKEVQYGTLWWRYWWLASKEEPRATDVVEESRVWTPDFGLETDLHHFDIRSRSLWRYPISKVSLDRVFQRLSRSPTCNQLLKPNLPRGQLLLPCPGRHQSTRQQHHRLEMQMWKWRSLQPSVAGPSN